MAPELSMKLNEEILDYKFKMVAVRVVVKLYHVLVVTLSED